MHDAEVNKVISNCDSISCKEVSSQLTCDFPTEPSGVTFKKLTRDITFFTPKKFAFIIKETAKCYWDKIEKIKTNWRQTKKELEFIQLNRNWPVIISLRKGTIFCLCNGLSTPSSIPNMLPRPRDRNMAKNRTDHSGEAGIKRIASVKAMKVRPGPWNFWRKKMR